MMESNRNTEDPPPVEKVHNTTYAEALSKGKNSGDVSALDPNANVSPPAEGVNGNPVEAELTTSAIIEDKAYNTSDSLVDSCDDEKDSQPDVDSSFNYYESSVGNLSSNDVSFNHNGNEESSVLNISQENSLGAEEYSESEEDSEGLDASSDDANMIMRSELRNNDPVLPETVTVLETANGSKVYIVGTAHFSAESQEDVSRTISAVQPDIVMLELCKTRINILCLDEKLILEEAKNMNFQKFRQAVEQNGFLQGALYCLLLGMSAHLTKELGMPPGGEFKRAYCEALKIPGCIIHLGDRPIHITLQRALATLSWWQKLTVAWQLLRSKEHITKEDVEMCKQKDLLEKMLAEMTGQFPELSQVFVNERDVYLTYSLQIAAAPMVSSRSPHIPLPCAVVGVVGIGHVKGIVENWGKVKEEDIAPILHIPEPSLTSRIVKKSFRIGLCVAGIYGIYRCFPRSLIPHRVKSLI